MLIKIVLKNTVQSATDMSMKKSKGKKASKTSKKTTRQDSKKVFGKEKSDKTINTGPRKKK